MAEVTEAQQDRDDDEGSMRRKLKVYLCVALTYIVYSPLMPIALLEMGFQGAADGINWLMTDSWLVIKIDRIADRIQAWGVR